MKNAECRNKTEAQPGRLPMQPRRLAAAFGAPASGTARFRENSPRAVPEAGVPAPFPGSDWF